MAAEREAPLTHRIPPPRWDAGRGLISRQRLLTRVRDSERSPLVVVAAPAGYGKTTLLSEWAKEDPRPFRWVMAEPRDNDPALLARTIAEQLDAIEPLDPAVFDLLSAGASAELISRLGAEVSRREAPFVLVIDDFHHVGNEESKRLVVALASALPAGSQLAIGSRGQPELGLGRLRAEGLLAEFGPRELAMTRAEVRAVAGATGLELEADGIAELHEHTEGWPVAVYLAARTLRDEPDPTAAARRFAGDDRVISDYLREEMLAVLDESDRGFLLGCSILEQLNGTFCDAVLDEEGTAETLRRLSQSNLLVIPLDRADREFRFHPLFRETLLAELERTDAVRKAELHRRASGFHAERGDADRAVEHAIATGDPDLAGELIWTNATSYVGRGRSAGVLDWLAHYTDERIAATPTLAMSRAAVAIREGDGPAIDRWAAAATASLDRVSEELRPGLELAVSLSADTAGLSGSLVAGRNAAVAARAALPPDSPWIAYACVIEGAAARLAGDPDAAREALEEGARHGDRHLPSGRTSCLAELALMALEAGDETEAWALEERARATVERYGLGDDPTQSLVAATTALIRARRGRIDEAILAARHTEALLATLPGTASWYEGEVRTVLARALIQLDDPAGARRWLDQAEPFVDACSEEAPVLAASFADARSALQDPDGEERWPLTPAELRLLHMLPSHFSFRDIADRLCVSTNTVKSQARSIYRKLGVASRAEAVSAARAGGLIDAGVVDEDPLALGELQRR